MLSNSSLLQFVTYLPLQAFGSTADFHGRTDSEHCREIDDSEGTPYHRDTVQGMSVHLVDTCVGCSEEIDEDMVREDSECVHAETEDHYLQDSAALMLAVQTEDHALRKDSEGLAEQIVELDL